MLPQAEIVFLDETLPIQLGHPELAAHHSQRASLLHRPGGGQGAAVLALRRTNQVPNDEVLQAIFDRFLIRAFSQNLDSYHFRGLVDHGIRAEIALAAAADESLRPLVSLAELRAVHRAMDRLLVFPTSFWPPTRGWSSRFAPRVWRSAIAVWSSC